MCEKNGFRYISTKVRDGRKIEPYIKKVYFHRAALNTLLYVYDRSVRDRTCYAALENVIAVGTKIINLTKNTDYLSSSKPQVCRM